MIDLIILWKNTMIQNVGAEKPSHNYPEGTKPAAMNFDMNTTQSSFEFKEQPKVIFVKNVKTLEPANFYDDLPEIILTPEEEAARLKVVAEQQVKNPHFYDGKQMIITGVVYDDSSNTLYMEASQIPYSFIVALSSKKFPENSDLYQRHFFKTGVLAPLVTRNGMSVLLQRAALGLYSVPSGFLESKDKEKRLNFNDGRNLVTETASAEIKEEVAGIKGSENLRFQYSTPQITSISFRQTTTSPIGTVEFVAPSQANCHSSYLQYVLDHNLAQDAHEHTSQHELIPLDSQDRGTLLTKLLTGPVTLPGSALYLPVALSLTRLENPNSHMALPREIPNSHSIAWPLTIFTAKLERPLSLNAEESDDEMTYDGGFNLIS